MKSLSVYFVLVLAGLMFFGSTEVTAQKKKMKKEKVLLAAEDMKWKDLPGGPGVMNAVVKGDDTKGPHAGFTKFPAGFTAPLHSHTYETKIIVIKGTYVHNGKAYGPGSYLSIPAGDVHTTAGAEDSESIFYLEQPGKFDLIPVEEKK